MKKVSLLIIVFISFLLSLNANAIFLSAGARELISPLTQGESQTTQLALSQLTGTLVGYAINKDKGATTGYNISTSAEEYNRQLHEKEIEFIKKNALSFAKKRFNTSNPTKTQIQEATKLLSQVALHNVDSWYKDIKEPALGVRV